MIKNVTIFHNYYEKLDLKQLNSYLISENDLENGMKGEYNVPRYISTFNKRVEPLLVCFKPEVRDTLLKKKPEDREYYTNTLCELINGVPRKEAELSCRASNDSFAAFPGGSR